MSCGSLRQRSILILRLERVPFAAGGILDIEGKEVYRLMISNFVQGSNIDRSIDSDVVSMTRPTSSLALAGHFLFDLNEIF